VPGKVTTWWSGGKDGVGSMGNSAVPQITGGVLQSASDAGILLGKSGNHQDCLKRQLNKMLFE
jgi:hypothetical protein